ncbi:SRPBCC family protein [Spiractinospora alimapuensis]|uniref:SRPBCC family protein n=1 Tax=Spiractinospora alimapuensis TaxID=2820884 RepID=UPI001F32E362|nr:SRPBCC family protein [Spiractinospora alimapuensis]QVQ54525.1 SRPBCC family protein [Spiractinospora alimapuensis]
MSATHSVVIDAPRDAVHRWNNEPDRDLGDLIEASDDFPQVVGTEIIWGEWDPEGDRSGDRRRVLFADGHSLAEEVLVDSSERFRYVIWGFTDFRRLAVDHGTAEFVFEDQGDQTRVTWTYQLRPTTPLVRPFVADFMTTTMSAMMTDTLEAMRTGVEAEQDSE